MKRLNYFDPYQSKRAITESNTAKKSLLRNSPELWSIFKNSVAAEVSRRKLNQEGIRWRELTFRATDLLKPF